MRCLANQGAEGRVTWGLGPSGLTPTSDGRLWSCGPSFPQARPLWFGCSLQLPLSPLVGALQILLQASKRDAINYKKQRSSQFGTCPPSHLEEGQYLSIFPGSCRSKKKKSQINISINYPATIVYPLVSELFIFLLNYS